MKLLIQFKLLCCKTIMWKQNIFCEIKFCKLQNIIGLHNYNDPFSKTEEKLAICGIKWLNYINYAK